VCIIHYRSGRVGASCSELLNKAPGDGYHSIDAGLETILANCNQGDIEIENGGSELHIINVGIDPASIEDCKSLLLVCGSCSARQVERTLLAAG